MTAAGWLLAGLLAGCSAGDASPAEAGGVGSGAAAPADGPVSASEILLDLRVPAASFEAPAAETGRVVDAVYGEGAPGDVQLTSRASGAFTAPGAQQTAYTLRRGGAAAGPAPARTMLAVLDDDDRVAAQFVVDHDRIAAAVDIEGDGLTELFLASDGYQMGQAYTGLELVSLSGGKRRGVAAYPRAWLDACANPAGDRYIQATLFVRGATVPALHRFRAACEADGPPRPDAYRPVAGPELED